ncbi:glycosyltransferase family 39 protein [Phenylobacterium sp.]|uniref:ArnT family glycosyltransferase n=1 Tax=Phenylobacterium sp. TaxID=1871053 RepID=UPI00286B0B6C|nr:glycosyltransferase family 39 protein [Phenylobacterium sp.]
MTALSSKPHDQTGVGGLTATNTVLLLIAGFTLLRVGSAMLIGLGVDEAYTLAIARQLQLSYFDHPPLHLWIVHLFGAVLGYGRLARLPFIALFAGSCWLLFRLTGRLFGERAGAWAVLTLNLSGFFTVVAGSWVLPDGPLIFCLVAAAGQLEGLLFRPGPDAADRRISLRAWSVAGLWIGLAGLSKYQAVLFAAGLVVFLFATARGRAWLRRPGPYLAALIAVAIVSPVIIWNAQHQWASFAFQGGRAAAAHGLRPLAPGLASLGQAALLLPWIFVPLIWAACRSLRPEWTDQRRGFCLALSLPGIVLFTLTPLWGQPSLPHWAMPAWLFLFPLLGQMLAEAAAWRRWPRIWAAASFVALGALWTVLLSDASTGWVGRTWPRVFAKGDPTRELVEWGPLARQLNDVTVLQGRTPFLVSMKWSEAGRLAPMAPAGAPVMVFSDDPRGFGYRRDVGALIGRDALIVVKPEDLADGLSWIRPCFGSVEPLKVAIIGRGGRPELQLHLLAGHDLQPACSQLGRPGKAALAQWRALKARPAPSRPASG